MKEELYEEEEEKISWQEDFFEGDIGQVCKAKEEVDTGIYIYIIHIYI